MPPRCPTCAKRALIQATAEPGVDDTDAWTAVLARNLLKEAAKTDPPGRVHLCKRCRALAEWSPIGPVISGRTTPTNEG